MSDFVDVDIYTSYDFPKQIYYPDKIAQTNGRTNGRRDSLIFKNFTYNSSDIFYLKIQKISFHANAYHDIPYTYIILVKFYVFHMNQL